METCCCKSTDCKHLLQSQKDRQNMMCCSNPADIEDGSSKQQQSATFEAIVPEDEFCHKESSVRKTACSSNPSDIEGGDFKRGQLASFEESARDYVNHNPQEKDKLNAFIEEIVTKVGVDFNNPEIQDIQSAVSEMIERIKTWINERGVLSISRTELCGSMAEKTATWKSKVLSKQHFIEFDFLAALQPACDIKAGCLECFRVNTARANLVLETYNPLYNSNVKDELIKRDTLEERFTGETNACLASCGCLEVEYPRGATYKFKPSSTCSKTQQGCDKCTVDRPTGTLRVKTSEKIGKLSENNCSLIFDWISKAKTLCTRDQWCLPKSKKMDNLTIHIDFVPVLEVFQSEKQSADVAACSSSDLVSNPSSSEYEHYCFLVPKHCVVCDKYSRKDTWRRSGCRAEIDTIVNKMSDKHRKCYQVLKYLIGRTYYLFNSYHLKIAVLHHNSSCSDTSEHCTKCVFKVLGELRRAYKIRKLKSLHSQANLLEQEHIGYCINCYRVCERLEQDMCFAVSESDSFIEEKLCKILRI